MKKIVLPLLLLTILLFSGCPVVIDKIDVYNPNAAPVYMNLSIENKTSATVKVKPFISNFTLDINDESYKSADYINEIAFFSKNESLMQEVTIDAGQNLNELNIKLADWTMMQLCGCVYGYKRKAWMGMFADITRNSDSSSAVTEKITGLPVEDILAMENVKDENFGGLETENFAYTNFGSYIVNSTETDHPESFGIYMCSSEKANGLKSGTINMNLVISDDGYSVEYK